MLRTITCAALALGVMSAYAQTGATNDPGMVPMYMNNDGMYWSDVDLMANPPTSGGSIDFQEIKRNVRHQSNWLPGAYRDHLQTMLWELPTNISEPIQISLYDARMDARMVRHDLVAEEVASLDQMAMSNSTPTSATMVNSDMIADNNLASVSNRPLKFVLSHPKSADINYNDAIAILDQGRTTTERTLIDSWWNETATEGDKDVIVKLLKNDAWILTVPIYASTLTHRTW